MQPKFLTVCDKSALPRVCIILNYRYVMKLKKKQKKRKKTMETQSIVIGTLYSVVELEIGRESEIYRVYSRLVDMTLIVMSLVTAIIGLFFRTSQPYQMHFRVGRQYYYYHYYTDEIPLYNSCCRCYVYTRIFE